MRMKMKRVFRRNQIIITTLAIMIAAAGYLNYAGKSDLPGADTYEAGATKISDSDIYSENQNILLEHILKMVLEENWVEIKFRMTERVYG